MIRITSNGSKWAGEEPEGLDYLFALLGREPLNPMFEAYGNFIKPAHCCTSFYDEKQQKRIYEDMGPIYPEAPTTMRFWGNFYRVSSVFEVDTDEAELIERLTTAIRANQATEAYQAARRERSLP